MGLLGMANVYNMRSSLSLALTAMVHSHHRPNNTFNMDADDCPLPQEFQNQSATNHMTNIEGTFEWNEEIQGMILAAFYYGYIITHVPGGMLAEKFGGKYTFGLGILSTTIFTLLTPFVVNHFDYKGLIILRFLSGLGEGTTFPALSTLLAQWAPPLEKSVLSSMCFAGVQLGAIMANLLGGFIIQHTGTWISMFYVFGTSGIIWFILWCLLCYNDPGSHPFISDEEKQYLAKTIGATERSKDLGVTPWKSILTSAPVWALIIGEIGHDWGLYTVSTELPKYIKDVMHINVAETGLMAAIPYITMWLCSMVVGFFADWLITSKIIDITLQRKLFATIGAIGPGLGVVLASYAGCNKLFVTVLFTIGMGLMGFCYASLRVNSLDLSPNYAGSIMALVNGIASVSGMATPTLTGYLIPDETVQEWRLVFWIMFGILFWTNFVFVWWGSGEVQPWNKINKTKISVSNGTQLEEI